MIIFLASSIRQMKKYNRMKIENEITNFLTDLANNNNRDWFAKNKERYNVALAKFSDFVDSLINSISVFDNSVQNLQAKDTIFRIYKDVRFSKDKSPYKNHFGAYIANGGRKSNKAGYYIHIEPSGQSFLGGGIHCPQPKELKAIRQEIVYNTDKYKNIIFNIEFNREFGNQMGDKLKSAPRGFDKDFKDLDLIKYKEYTFGKLISNNEIMDDKFLERAVATFKILKPYNTFLNDALFEL